MTQEVFQLPDGPEMRAWLASEERAIERLLLVARTAEPTDVARSRQLMVIAARRAKQLLEIRAWLEPD